METKVISGVRLSSLLVAMSAQNPTGPICLKFVSAMMFRSLHLGCKDSCLLVKQIGDACREYGFFQVINHGVPKETMDKMVGVAHEFFSLSVEEKMKLHSDDPSKTMRRLVSPRLASSISRVRS